MNERHAQKGRRLWLGDEWARREGEALLDRVAQKYDITYSWTGRCSSAMDSLRLVLWAQSLGKNEVGCHGNALRIRYGCSGTGGLGRMLQEQHIQQIHFGYCR
eukprot:g1881.t1